MTVFPAPESRESMSMAVGAWDTDELRRPYRSCGLPTVSEDWNCDGDSVDDGRVDGSDGECGPSGGSVEPLCVAAASGEVSPMSAAMAGKVGRASGSFAVQMLTSIATHDGWLKQHKPRDTQ
jgi:hypothetical protein